MTNATDPSGLKDLAQRFSVTWGGYEYLVGKLFVKQNGDNLNINMHVRRPHERPGFQERWNGLGDEVPDYWNREESADGWLWPHLYQMLNYGKPKYGGWDPSKQVDNDYAAILVRHFDEHGKEIGSPLVSAAWHQVGGTQTLSHVAGSERFDLNPGTCTKGVYKLWFVFADTWGTPFVNDAPLESAGGTIAYFEISYSKMPHFQFTVTQPGLPAPPTNFDWDAWDGHSELGP